MATLRLNQGAETKHKLSNTLRNWLPILHASLTELESTLSPFLDANPIVEATSGFERSFGSQFSKKLLNGNVSNSRTEQIEALTVQERSLYDELYEQINSSLFPTPRSQAIAHKVIENLDENGYFEGDVLALSEQVGCSEAEFERVRERFKHLEPAGIGAKDLKESFLFQLELAEPSDAAYNIGVQMIASLEDIVQFSKEEGFDEALDVISSFSNPPALQYAEKEAEVIPDLMIYQDDEGQIHVKLNDEYYPTITIDSDYGVEHEYISQKIKEAKSLVDALEMRKATLYKVGLMIVEYQYDFFTGGAIMPMTLKTLADEFGHNPSTISRAIANKYIACDRGIMAMKEFFTAAIDEDVSNAAIKEYLQKLVKEEPKQKPLSDMKLLDMIQEQFKVKMVRRTIAKYRKQLNIAGSSERKKLYMLERN